MEKSSSECSSSSVQPRARLNAVSTHFLSSRLTGRMTPHLIFTYSHMCRKPIRPFRSSVPTSVAVALAFEQKKVFGVDDSIDGYGSFANNYYDAYDGPCHLNGSKFNLHDTIEPRLPPHFTSTGYLHLDLTSTFRPRIEHHTEVEKLGALGQSLSSPGCSDTIQDPT